MKTFLKFFIVFILVVGSIGGTAWAFYANLTEQRDAFAHINTFINNADKSSIELGFDRVSNVLGDAYDEHMATIDKLDIITHELNTYMINSLDYDVDNNSIIRKFDRTQSSQYTLKEYIVEFEAKKDNELFNKNQGGSDVFAKFAAYVVNYADAVQHMNKEIEDNMIVDHSADIKFEIIELYCLAVKDCYTQTEVKDNLLNVKNLANVSLLNEKFDLEHGLVSSTSSAGVPLLSKYNNYFITAFDSLSDKLAFASALATNYATVDTITPSSTNVEKATYYLKEILG